LSLKEEEEEEKKLDSVLPDNRRRRRRESSLLGQSRFAQPNRHVLRAASDIFISLASSSSKIWRGFVFPMLLLSW
jgi:hypothetical protein